MKKILVVEDDKDISRALSIRLRAAAYEVFIAQDAVQGVSMANKHMPDLMLLDISMPAGSGFSVAERVQDLANTAGTPMIFITASKEPELREKAMELGAAAYFEKPFDSEQLLESIEQVMTGEEH